MTAIALTIAGSDSGGGAGIQADLKTFSALGVYGASVLTALTAQNTWGVRAVHDVPADFVTAQLDAVFDDLDVDAVKIGMLSQTSAIEAVAASLRGRAARNVVLDPVMVAASGDPLIADEAVDTLRRTLLPLADVVTPNMPEAARMLDRAEAPDEAGMRDQAEALVSLGARAVLLKGGHGDGPESVDILPDGQEIHRLAAPRVDTRNTHGTGCTLSSAIAANLAQGASLLEAVTAAKSYVSRAIAHADALRIGHGHGPVHHFHDMWSP